MLWFPKWLNVRREGVVSLWKVNIVTKTYKGTAESIFKNSYCLPHLFGYPSFRGGGLEFPQLKTRASFPRELFSQIIFQKKKEISVIGFPLTRSGLHSFYNIKGAQSVHNIKVTNPLTQSIGLLRYRCVCKGRRGDLSGGSWRGWIGELPVFVPNGIDTKFAHYKSKFEQIVTAHEFGF